MTPFPGGVETFADVRISEIWPLVRFIHKVFAESGYRHSDVALFDSVFQTNQLQVKGIPELVSRMECAILRSLIENGITDDSLRLTAQTVESTVHECQARLADRYIALPGTIEDKVARYYRTVLNSINS